MPWVARGILARMRSGSRDWSVRAGKRCARERLIGKLVLSTLGILGTLGILLFLVAGARAQTATATPAHGDQPYTLHVYEDLVQVPALVLTSTHESYRGLPPKRFEVQLDGGPKFHPKEARPEGDDPLSLSLLLDARRGEHQDLVRGISTAIARLPQDLLTSRDHVSVFAYDCTLVSSVLDEPASTAVLHSGVAAALAAPRLHGEPGSRGRCRAPIHLWDAMATVTSRVRSLPGRRVLVVVSDGHDWGSKSTADLVRVNASGFGLAIFGVEPAPPQRPVLGLRLPTRLAMETAMDDAFGVLCNGTGGLVVGGDRDDLDETLARIVRLVRGRYILEFARPQNGTAGSHRIDVSVTDASAIVRSSGVAVGLQDEAQRNDAHTVPKDTSKDPVIGQSKRQR